MKRIKKWLKRLFKIIGILLIPVLTYFLLGIILSLVSTRSGEVPCLQKEPIYISSNGIHLDIILHEHMLPDSLRGALTLPSRVNHVAFGWGDKGFYLETPTWSELKTSVALKALFWKSGTAMHVTHYQKPHESWYRLMLCPGQIETINNYIWQSFRKTADGRILEIADSGYTSYDRFYEATGSYSCLKTCNNWVNIGLKKAGVKTAVWSPFDYGVLYHLEKQE